MSDDTQVTDSLDALHAQYKAAQEDLEGLRHGTALLIQTWNAVKFGLPQTGPADLILKCSRVATTMESAVREVYATVPAALLPAKDEKKDDAL